MLGFADAHPNLRVACGDGLSGGPSPPRAAICSLPYSQGRVGVGLLFAWKIKSFTPSQPPLQAGEGENW